VARHSLPPLEAVGSTCLIGLLSKSSLFPSDGLLGLQDMGAKARLCGAR
jgi:hypothetical protein